MVRLGAACLMLIVVSSFSMVWLVLRGVCPGWRVAVLPPDGLNSMVPMLTCPPYRSETSATIWGVGSRHMRPITPEHRGMGRIWPCPPPRAITKRRTRCQSNGRDSPSLEERAPQLTRTDPSQKSDPPQPGTPVGAEQNHKRQAEPAAEPERSSTTQRRGAKPAAAAEAAERGSAE